MTARPGCVLPARGAFGHTLRNVHAAGWPALAAHAAALATEDAEGLLAASGTFEATGLLLPAADAAAQAAVLYRRRGQTGQARRRSSSHAGSARCQARRVAQRLHRGKIAVSEDYRSLSERFPAETAITAGRR